MGTNITPRCVNCSQFAESHKGETLACPGSAGLVGRHYQTMQLPPGLTCNDCRFMNFCRAFLGREGSETSCDWFPIKFVPDIAKFQKLKQTEGGAA